MLQLPRVEWRLLACQKRSLTRLLLLLLLCCCFAVLLCCCVVVLLCCRVVVFVVWLCGCVVCGVWCVVCCCCCCRRRRRRGRGRRRRGGGGGTDQMLMTCLCRYATTHAPDWVAEHLGASSRRPRHPFPALMTGVTPGRVPVYTAQKSLPITP